MNDYRARRATTDDLGTLVGLWQRLQMPAVEMEQRFTEFQLVEDAQGRVVGAIAVQISGGEGRVHSETIPDFSMADALRPVFWERIQSIARNNGLMRLWTEETALFWKKDAGFADVGEERLKRLPEVFGSRRAGWLALQLRPEESSPEALARQVELIFATHETEIKTAKLKAQEWARHGKTLTVIAVIISALLFVTALIALFKVAPR